jgi:hypothetical protein
MKDGAVAGCRGKAASGLLCVTGLAHGDRIWAQVSDSDAILWRSSKLEATAVALRPGAAGKLALAGAGARRCRNGDVNRAAIVILPSDYCGWVLGMADGKNGQYDIGRLF